jgi:hypothetical protein
MTIIELIAQYRRESQDGADSLVSDADLVVMFNDAVDEACIRKPLIFDATTAAVCEIEGTAILGATYNTHEAIIQVDRAYLVNAAGAFTYLAILSREALDDSLPCWREESGVPHTLLVDETSATLVPPPEEDFTLKLEVYRQPLADDKLVLVSNNSPAIASTHHRYLVHGVLAIVYNRDDVAVYAPGKGAKHEGIFDRYFGLPPTACQGKRSREDVQHHNKTW